MNANYLAFDLGAESGRAILGVLRSGVLTVSEVRRFQNEPIRDGASLRWDVRRLWQEMQRALDDSLPELASVGVDTWGVDYALIGKRRGADRESVSLSRSRTNGVMDAVLQKVTREADLFGHRGSVPAVQYAVSTFCGLPFYPESIAAAERW